MPPDVWIDKYQDAILCFLVYSYNSTLTRLDVFINPMSVAAHMAIKVKFVLCKMRNPTVNSIDASGEELDDQGAVMIGKGLRYVFRWTAFSFVMKKHLRQRHLICQGVISFA